MIANNRLVKNIKALVYRAPILVGLILSLCCAFASAAALDAKDFSNLAIRRWVEADQQKTVSKEHATTWSPLESSQKTLLIFHGLHESPFFMRNWTEFFMKRGFNVLNVRLPGHFEPGTRGLKDVQSEQWLTTADKAYELVNEISSEIAVLGFSTGGTLSAYLALKHPDKIKNLFLMSPAFYLSNRVYISTRLLGPTEISSIELCGDVNSNICRFIMASDPEYKMMIQNGLVISPQAGLEVQDLINQVFETLKLDMNMRNSGPYRIILEKLDKISATVAMVNTESDVVVSENFNNKWIENFKGRKFHLMYRKSDHIYHALINKNYDTRFPIAEMGYNIRISEVENLFDEALTVQ